MSISYQDWRKDVNALMRRKIPEKKILDAIMNSVEGGPGETASVAYEKGRGSLKEVLEALDTVHGRSISYIKLHSDLCAMRQYYDEDVVCYYTRMNSIVYLLQEHHDTQFPPGQLARFTKQAFYDGLLEKYKPLVSHLMDRPKKGVGVVLSAVRKAEEAEERQLAARRMEARSGYNKMDMVPPKDMVTIAITAMLIVAIITIIELILRVDMESESEIQDLKKTIS